MINYLLLIVVDQIWLQAEFWLSPAVQDITIMSSLAVKNHPVQILKTILSAHTIHSAGAVWLPPEISSSSLPHPPKFLKVKDLSSDMLLQVGTPTHLRSLPHQKQVSSERTFPSAPQPGMAKAPVRAFLLLLVLLFSPTGSIPFLFLYLAHFKRTVTKPQQGMATGCDWSPVLGPMCLSGVAPGGRRKDRRKRKKKQQIQKLPVSTTWGRTGKCREARHFSEAHLLSAFSSNPA